MQNSRLFSVCMVLLSTKHLGLYASNCDDVEYIMINDPRRSTANTNSPNLICDGDLIQDNAWYRFYSEAGEELSTTQPRPSGCGTEKQIWMSGSHPTAKENAVQRKVCVGRDLSCRDSYNITVRNCSGYYIYRLKRPPVCFLAYCVGSRLPANCTNATCVALENRPPQITMAERFYAVKNSKFQLFINASDPEGYSPLDYKCASPCNTENVHVAVATVSVIKSGKVTLVVTDRDKMQNSHTIEIIAISPPSGADCIKTIMPVSENREDIAHYIEEFCSISPCFQEPCFAGVKCEVKSDDYRCDKCPLKFQGNGRHCKLVEDKIFKVNAELIITSGLEWNSSLSDNTSWLYKRQTNALVVQIINAYNGSEEFIFALVDRYRKEGTKNVGVYFQVIFKKKIKEPLTPLRTAITSWGDFEVKPNSLKEKTTSTSSKAKEYFGLNKTSFIIVVCVFLLCLLGFMILCGICIKKKHIAITMHIINTHDRVSRRNQVMDSSLVIKP